MKKISKLLMIIVCLFTLLSINVYAQDYNYFDKIILSEDKEVPIKVQKNGMWGLIDNNGSIIAAPYWDSIGDYSDGLFLVKKGLLYGYIDNKGKVIIEPEFGQAVNFSEGLTSFKRLDLFGFMDKGCNVIIEPVWKEVSEFKNGLAKVVDSKGKSGIIDKTGKVIVEPIWEKIGDLENGLYAVALNGKMGFINKSGNIVVDLVYDWVEGFNNGISKVVVDGKYGLVDINNKLITKPTWDYIGDFRDNMLSVSSGIESIKYGYIDYLGELKIKPTFDNTVAFNEGLAPVMKDGLWGYIDKTGKQVIPCSYKYAGLYYNGITVVSNADGKYMFIDKTGKKINDKLWDNYSSYVNNKLIPVNKDGKWGFMSPQGLMLTKNIYEDVTGYFEGYIGVKLNGKWGFVDEKGKLVVDAVWDKIDRFYNGIAVVSKDNQYTLIDNMGNYPFISSQLAAMEKIGLIKGDGNGVDKNYAAKSSTRMQSAIMLLRMNRLEADALKFKPTTNFNEAKNYNWVEGANIMGYLKANPAIGFIGDGKNNLNPDSLLTQKQYVKVMLETLGYRQDIDFKYNDVYKFAQSIGVELKESSTFTNDDLAKVTVTFLNANTKDGIKLIDKLIKKGTINEKTAIEAMLK